MYESVIASIKSDKAQFKKEIAQLEKIQRQLEELNIDSVDLRLEIRSRKDRFNSLCDELDSIKEQVKLEKKQQAQITKQQRIDKAVLRGIEDRDKVNDAKFSYEPYCPYKQKYLKKAWLQGLHSLGYMPYKEYLENAVTISLERAEGTVSELYDKDGNRTPPTVSHTWEEANKTLANWAKNAPNLGYTKTDIIIDWNDQGYKFTFHIDKTMMFGVDLKTYLWEVVSVNSGDRKPSHMNDKEYMMYLRNYTDEESRKIYRKIAQKVAA